MWEAGLKGVWLSLQPVCGPDLAPLQTLPLTIHRPELLHMGPGQDLFVQSLSLRVLALL